MTDSSISMYTVLSSLKILMEAKKYDAAIELINKVVEMLKEDES